MTEELKHPEPCQACDDYYAYQNGLCWQCWHARQEELATTEAMRERAGCED